MDDVRSTLIPAATPILVFLGLIVLEPDLGTAIACAGIAGCVLYVAGMRMRYFGYAIVASLPVLYILIFHVAWRRDRILAFLNPYADRQRTGFHIIQSLIAVGTGGLTGLGLMEGKQKLFYLPEPHTDFIFAVTAEELGLLGSLFVVTLFAIFLWRGMRASWQRRWSCSRVTLLTPRKRARPLSWMVSIARQAAQSAAASPTCCVGPCSR